ncbi:DNA polymerase i [Heliomicrobium modesticaldum Ice1]|uniref:DNA polymerase I n=1 Tax=Heliobacterium modesticaldum (strain ATCC 51547 / Ice1) TaxID=498761 RepID=B0TER6_HELMI|nr:DNA polymerase I [Heliomicrobium modesticaldum]ABZ84318.1 DNA polymerase i [Heliomicrobium modesticaldum Ice1]
MRNAVFMVIDGSSLLHRAFYALPLMSTSQGVHTNAVYGFLTMLERLRREYQPDFLAVCLDKSRITHRTQRYEAYKAQRGATPEELRPQFGLLKEVLAAWRIPLFEEEGYEADDLIGALVCLAKKQGIDSLIVTGDRDAWQLISPGVEVLFTRKGISELERYDEEALKAKIGLTPRQVVDWKGLMGDPSDNIPGVPGVGEKRAFKLLEQFGDMDSLYERLDEVKGKLKEKLATHREQAFLSRELATIQCNIPLEPDWEACRAASPDFPALRRLYKKLEFRSLLRHLPGDEGDDEAEGGSLFARQDEQAVSAVDPMGADGTAGGGVRCSAAEGDKPGDGQAVRPDQAVRIDVEAPLTVEYTAVEDGNAIGAMLTELMQIGAEPGCRTAVLAAWEGSPRTGKLKQIVLAAGRDALLRLWVIDRPGAFFAATKPFWASKDHRKLFFDAKSLWLLARREDTVIEGIDGDGLLGAYLLDPLANRYSLARSAHDWIGWKVDTEAGRSVLPPEEGARAAAALFHMTPVMEARLGEEGLCALYRDVELPLAPILGAMEWTGIKVNPAVLQEMAGELGADIRRLQADIYDLAGESFNINSTQQFGKILFEKLGLPVIKRTKTGYSTDVEVLEELADRHPIVPKVLEYRQLMKLKSTYVEGLLPLIDGEDGRIHTSFNQAVTATGRLSSTEPNLQNIPVRLEQGRRIRKAFTAPGDDWTLLAADYSQIELRILAHLSGDPSFKDAFAKNQDIHTRTASEVFGVPMENVTSEMRRRAKAVNFGIVYGISDFGLSRDLGVLRAEARQYIDGYFDRYSGVKGYIDEIIAEARRQGYVTTLLGRRRRLPDLFVKNKIRQNFGERAAMNTPIQGTAADIIKAAMVRIPGLLAAKGLKTRMLLQVHDELIFEAPKEELSEAAALIRETMEQTIRLDVPLTVDVKTGPNWYEMKPYL